MPSLQRPQQLAVAGQVHVVGNGIVVIDLDEAVARDRLAFFDQGIGTDIAHDALLG
jgi:hypothetical protein